MKYFNRDGLDSVSKIGIGAARFGSIVDEVIAFDMLDMFTAYGGNVIDTARNYYEWIEGSRGVSEKTIGKWISSRNSRNNIIISTKGGVRNTGSTFHVDLSKENLVKEAKESMEALQTDKIDIYYLHRDERDRSTEEIVDTMMLLREITSCHAFGVSNWKIDRIKYLNACAQSRGLPIIDTIQTWWSIADYTYAMWNDPTTTWMDRETYEYSLEKNMFILASTSQAKGFFQKAILGGYDTLKPSLKKRIVSDENLRRLDLISSYCKKHNVSPTSIVNSYITSNDLCGVALVSCSSLEQLKDILNHIDDDVDKTWLKQFNPR